MITADPGQRKKRLAAIQQILAREAAVEDRELIAGFAPPVFAAMPDWMALGLSVPELAGRIRDNYRFFAHELPPPTQLYKGLPGIHAVVRNAGADEVLGTARGKVMPQETTIIETHTRDAPFIFDSLQNYIRKSGLRVFSALHPILSVKRQWERIVRIGALQEEGAMELLCRFRIERVESGDRLRRMEHEIFCLLKCVFLAVEDFQQMAGLVRELGSRLHDRRGGPAPEERAFLGWLLDDNYVFMGTVQYQMGGDGQPGRVQETATGVFRDPSLLPVVFPGLVEEVEAHLLPAENDDRVVDLDYCHNASAIYHLEPIDDVVIREWGPDGRLEGATLLMGRLALGAFAQKAAGIPLLRRKHEVLLAESGVPIHSHAYRQIRGLFSRFPKRELFYSDVGSLKQIIDQVVHMTGDDEIAVHCREGLGYAALTVALSRLRYSYETETDLRAALSEAFGPISFSTAENAVAVSLVVFYFDSARLERPIDLETARSIVASRVTTWGDRVSDALVETFGEAEGRRLFDRHVRGETRSGLYRESTAPEDVPADLQHVEAVERRLEVALVPRSAEQATLTLYSPRPLGLMETLATLRNLGLRVTGELRIPLRLLQGRRVFLYRYEIEDEVAVIAAAVEGRERLAEAVRALDEGRATDGSLNGLILRVGLTWREVEILRTFRNHLLQIRPHYNAETVNDVMLRNSAVAEALFRRFEAGFDPRLEAEREPALERSRARAAQALESVASLTEDQILRALANLIDCCLRTNYYQYPERPVFAIKVDSRRVEAMPPPRPRVEIYVHSRQIEGIHLRGGPVARGGVRWSDRLDDFRTEVLGLMKTQMVKNSIIVPVGSKGGFVLKGPLPGRPALGGHLTDRYREFVSGLLDITDNMVDGRVVHPPDVVRYDGDDPYLVVAADKGTAHLSDTANAVSAHYGFWLGDAFASGGSVGYDHKKVGITARGTWECVRHHFHTQDADVQKDVFTAVGIGDMSGDVFGNGALRTRAMKLVAAFNHQHIFVDPDPDPEASYRERERLFRLPRSSWRDYDASAISPGGGVFDRSAKAIPVSPETRALLDLEADSVSGEELIRRILTARADLLYNGGIGTYVKGSDESDAEVGDRANDRVRVEGKALRARVVGEGGNLGLTQKARLECWARGTLVYTDAVDNSGGVDISDHEVNIKILLDLLHKMGALESKAQRNQLLMDVTEEVVGLVLEDNASQARAISLDSQRSQAHYEDFVALIDDMVGASILDRADEAVPRRPELLDSPQRHRGIPLPLLAVLLGYTKMWGFGMLMETGLPESPAGEPFLRAYFPEGLQRFEEHFSAHPLRREIVATAIVNHVVNNAGIGFLSRVMEASHAGPGEVVAAYLGAERLSGAREVRAAVAEAGLSAQRTLDTWLETEEVLEALARTCLSGGEPDASSALDGVREVIVTTRRVVDAAPTSPSRPPLEARKLRK